MMESNSEGRAVPLSVRDLAQCMRRINGRNELVVREVMTIFGSTK